MINFYSVENQANVIPISKGNDWPIIGHVKLYTENFNNFNNQYNSLFQDIDTYVADNNNGECLHQDTYAFFKEQFKDKLPTLLGDLTAGMDSMYLDNMRTSDVPSFTSTAGIFAKLVDVLDTGADNFLNNYSMARQMEKYECSYLTLFRFLMQLQGTIKSGTIMGYFDNIYKEFKESLDAFRNYIILDTRTNPPSYRSTCEQLEAIHFGLYNEYEYAGETFPAFNNHFQEYQAALLEGFEDLNLILDTFQGFYDELYLGMKVISAINMVFYSDPQDADMIRNEGASNFSFLTLSTEGNDAEDTRTLKARTLYCISISIPMALDAIQYIDSTRSNINTILAQLIHNVLDALGILPKLTAMKEVVLTQGGEL